MPECNNRGCVEEADNYCSQMCEGEDRGCVEELEYKKLATCKNCGREADYHQTMSPDPTFCSYRCERSYSLWIEEAVDRAQQRAIDAAE